MSGGVRDPCHRHLTIYFPLASAAQDQPMNVRMISRIEEFSHLFLFGEGIGNTLQLPRSFFSEF